MGQELVIAVEEPSIAGHDNRYGSQGRSGRDEEQDDDLIHHSLQGINPGEQLAGHHSGQTDEADDRHGVDDGDHAGADGVADAIPSGFPAGGSQGEKRLHMGTTFVELLAQAIQTDRDPVERVAEDHAEQRDRILGKVGRLDADDTEYAHRRDQPRAGPDGQYAVEPYPPVAKADPSDGRKARNERHGGHQ